MEGHNRAQVGQQLQMKELYIWYILGTKVRCVHCTELAYGLAFRYSFNRLLPHTSIVQKGLLDSDRWMLRICIQQDFTFHIGIMTDFGCSCIPVS